MVRLYDVERIDKRESQMLKRLTRRRRHPKAATNRDPIVHDASAVTTANLLDATIGSGLRRLRVASKELRSTGADIARSHRQ